MHAYIHTYICVYPCIEMFEYPEREGIVHVICTYIHTHTHIYIYLYMYIVHVTNSVLSYI
jgi:hypothetical protein